MTEEETALMERYANGTNRNENGAQAVGWTGKRPPIATVLANAATHYGETQSWWCYECEHLVRGGMGRKSQDRSMPDCGICLANARKWCRKQDMAQRRAARKARWKAWRVRDKAIVIAAIAMVNQSLI